MLNGESFLAIEIIVIRKKNEDGRLMKIFSGPNSMTRGYIINYLWNADVLTITVN